MEALFGVAYLKAHSDCSLYNLEDAWLVRQWLGLSCFLNRLVFAVWQFGQRYVVSEDFVNLEQWIMHVSKL